MIDNPHLR